MFYGDLPLCARKCGHQTANAGGVCKRCLEEDEQIRRKPRKVAHLDRIFSARPEVLIKEKK
jgi:hypothetical protein